MFKNPIILVLFVALGFGCAAGFWNLGSQLFTRHEQKKLVPLPAKKII